jgi:hypothetical protein
MPIISKPFSFQDGQVAEAPQVNADLDTLYNLVNGGLDNTNLASNAAIADSQLSQITTAGKVSGTTLTSLASIPIGAGIIPAANTTNGFTTQNVVTGSRALSNGTTNVYQNTTGKTMQVNIFLLASSGNNCNFKVGNTSTPGSVLGGIAAAAGFLSIFAPVLNGMYYALVDNSGSGTTIETWTETY